MPAASGFVHDPPVSDPTPTSLKEPGEPDPADSSSESRLLEEARQGSSWAAGALFERYRSWLRKRMRGRLPPWARGSLDTSVVTVSVVDALDRSDELELGDLVDEVEVVEALDAVEVSLVDGIDPQVAGLSEGVGPAPLADGDVHGAARGGAGIVPRRR